MSSSGDAIQDRVQLLAELARALASAGSRPALAETCARHLVPAIGDGCAVELGDAVAVAHRAAETAAALRAMPAADVVTHAHGQPVHRAIELGTAHGRIVVWREDGGAALTDDELALLRACAGQVELALAHASAVSSRDQFLSVAVHEMRTPLSVLTLQLDMVTRLTEGGAGDKDERVLDKITGAQEQLRRLSELIDRLLDVTRISAGRIVLDRRDLDLADLVRGTIDRVATQAAEAGCELAIQLDPVTGRWDPVRIDQIVTALLSNALKFGAGAPVIVRVAADGDRAILDVRDHGIGISADTAARLFDKFAAHAGDGLTATGLGVGLYVARELARAHGGDVVVEPPPDPGARFRVVLPRA